MGSAIAIYNGHLYVHKDYVRFEVWRVQRVGCGEVIEGFFAVPDCRDDEAEFVDGFEGYLLVDGTVTYVSSFELRPFDTWYSAYLSSTSKILILDLSSKDRSSSVGAGGVILMDLGFRRIL